MDVNKAKLSVNQAEREKGGERERERALKHPWETNYDLHNTDANPW